MLLCGLSWTARADSDGYYCSGTDYVAFQLRSALTPGVSSAHIVRIVRFGGTGLYVAGEVSLPDFQPHKLVCGKSQVRIGGWMGRPVEFVIDITEAPRIAQEISDPGQALQGSELRNLGAWARAGTVPLTSTDRAHKYHLVTTTEEKSVRGGLLHGIRTLIEKLDASGAIVESLELYSGSRMETVH